MNYHVHWISQNGGRFDTHFYANYTRAIVYKTKSNREYPIKIFDNPI